jgi:hypothetical protein
VGGNRCHWSFRGLREGKDLGHFFQSTSLQASRLVNAGGVVSPYRPHVVGFLSQGSQVNGQLQRVRVLGCDCHDHTVELEEGQCGSQDLTAPIPARTRIRALPASSAPTIARAAAREFQPSERRRRASRYRDRALRNAASLKYNRSRADGDHRVGNVPVSREFTGG